MARDYKQSQKNREAYTALVPEAELGGLVPPQAVELEEAVLGALMLESDSVTTVQEYLSEDSFYTEEHRIIYHAINELATVGKPVDIYTVTEYLKANRQLTKVGGAAYLAKLTQKIGAAANVIVTENAHKAGHKISFMYYLKYGVLATLISLVMASVFVWVKYLI